MEKANSTIGSALFQCFTDRKSRLKFILFTMVYSVFMGGIIFFCLLLLKSVGIGKDSTGYQMISWSLLLFFILAPYYFFRHEKTRK